MSSWRTEQSAEPCRAEALEAGGQATRSVVVRRTRAGIRGHGGLLKFGVVMVVEAELARGGVAGRYIVGGAGHEYRLHEAGGTPRGRCDLHRLEGRVLPGGEGVDVDQAAVKGVAANSVVVDRMHMSALQMPLALCVANHD